MIGDDHADVVTSARDRGGQQSLLQRLAGYPAPVMLGRQHCQIVQAYETDARTALGLVLQARSGIGLAFADS
jgi:hypothetical protein